MSDALNEPQPEGVVPSPGTDAPVQPEPAAAAMPAAAAFPDFGQGMGLDQGSATAVTASSRPVKETGWKERNGIFFGLSSANWMIRPTCSLLMPLMMVMTGMISTPFECRFSMARSLTSNRLPTLRC